MKKILTAICFGLSLAGHTALAQTVYTFTTGGAEGTQGPTQGQLDTAYSGTTLDSAVTSTGGIQSWTVPVSGNYQVEAFGAQGYGNFGGRGAHISGEFALTAGTVIKVLVGQQGAPYLSFPAATYNHQFGGGGGSFVTTAADVPMVIAGGGGGSHLPAFAASVDGQIGENGAGGTGSTVGAGGTAGGGGAEAVSADGGAGLLGNGGGTAGGVAFVNGGQGGSDEGFGGFGGGGGTSSWNNYRGGGGGGYSGGGGGNNGGLCCAAGGGGGSYNDGTSPVNLAGVQLGDGSVRITFVGYRVGGTVSGLVGSLTLQNNGADDLVVAADGSFSFASGLLDTASYDVSISAQPAGQTCTVTNGTGTIAGADVTNVDVSCVSDPQNVGGTLSGLATGQSLTLQNNGTDDLVVSANGAFTFATQLQDPDTYSVTILEQPRSQTCSVTNGSGVVGVSAITDVAIACGDNPVEIPTVGVWGLGALSALLALLGGYSRRRGDVAPA